MYEISVSIQPNLIAASFGLSITKLAKKHHRGITPFPKFGRWLRRQKSSVIQTDSPSKCDTILWKMKCFSIYTNRRKRIHLKKRAEKLKLTGAGQVSAQLMT